MLYQENSVVFVKHHTVQLACGNLRKTDNGRSNFLPEKYQIAGIKTRNSSFYGDQYIHFNVNIPVNLTQRQLMLIAEFAKEEQGEDEKDAKAAGASG